MNAINATRFIILFDVAMAAFTFAPTPAETSPPAKDEPSAAVGDLDGIYSCRGKQGDKTYSASATIRKVGDVYLFEWSLHARGIGVRKGDTISVGWTNETGQGVTVYKIAPGPMLTGSWASIPGNGRTNAESLRFLRLLPNEDDDGD